MKLLVFAHVPPPHHGQAVMVELMLRGLGGNKPQIAQISQMKQVDRAVPGAMGSTNAQSASFLKDDLPQRDAEDTKNVEPQWKRLRFPQGRCRGAGVEGCSRTRERLDEKTLDLPKSHDFGYDLPISATEVGQTRRCPSIEPGSAKPMVPPQLFGRFEGVARWGTRWLMGSPDRTPWGSDLRFRV
jgi:hypothetical protein